MTPHWNRNYRRRHPLTQHFARTLDEIDDDAYESWWEGPAPGEKNRFRLPEALRWVGALLLLSLIVSAPHWWPK